MSLIQFNDDNTLLLIKFCNSKQKFINFENSQALYSAAIVSLVILFIIAINQGLLHKSPLNHRNENDE